MSFLGFFKKTKISDLVPGKIYSIKGEIHSSRHLTLPPSGTQCVYYAMIEERYGKGARGSGRPLWFPEKMESKRIDFTIKDDTGEIAVEESTDRFSVKSARQESGLIKGNRKRRYFATTLNIGDVVIVRGCIESTSSDGRLLITAPTRSRLKVKVVRRANLSDQQAK